MGIMLRQLFIQARRNRFLLWIQQTSKCLCCKPCQSSPLKKEHLEITASQHREEIISPAFIVSLWNESPTVRAITLQVENPDFAFKAGQWIDLFIPGIDKVGGFSIWSSPRKLRTKGQIDLSIKQSAWPPANWIHNECQIGSRVLVRSGGNFTYDPSDDALSQNLLLIAGGVGINPVMSILLHAAELSVQYMQGIIDNCPGKILLLFSARTEDELLYKEMLARLTRNVSALQCEYFITRSEAVKDGIHNGRISEKVLEAAIDSLGRENTLTYICGPPPMIADMDKTLQLLDFPVDKIHYEKWW